MRLFLIVVAVVAIVLIVRFMLRQRRNAASPRTVVAGDMVRCAHCGLHLPAGSALRDGEHWYCSPEHRRLGRGDTRA
jgi:uncharacterized protein